MRIELGLALGLVAAGLALGCSGNTVCDNCADPGSGGSTGTGSGASSGTGAGGGSSAEWTTLITGDWELDPGSEITSDIHSITLDRDIYVGAIRPIAPNGTHHTVLALGDGSLEAGNIIHASGVGTNALEFPAGVGLKLPAGQILVLQLHLFNTSGDTITGTSGIEIVERAPSEVEQEADLFLPGPLELEVPPNQEHTESGTCTVNAAQNLFAVFPHMHQLGTHFKTTLTLGGSVHVLHDGDYAFNEQAFIPFEPMALAPGDSITTECTWTNDTSQTIGWGESSTSEMCFSILYRYPAQDDGSFCDG